MDWLILNEFVKKLLVGLFLMICTLNFLKFGWIHQKIEMSKGTSHSTNQIFFSNWIFNIVMVNNILNPTNVIPHIIIIQIEPTIFVHFLQIIFVKE